VACERALTQGRLEHAVCRNEPVEFRGVIGSSM
jgi:hypothetical protein